MQSVSSNYNPYPDERWSNVRVSFGLIDVDAAEDATPTATSEAEISKLEQIHNRIIKTDKKVATLEQDYFLLDGTYELPEEDNGEVGWWSGEISDSNGIFAIPQVLECTFSELQSSVGFTIIFDEKTNQHASDFRIEIFDVQNKLVGEDNVVGNTLDRHVSEMPVDGYNRVRITFVKTHLPFRRVRVTELVFGVIRTFNGDNVTNLTLLTELSPTMENLPTGELVWTFENVDRKYNMINPDGVYRYLQQGQKITAEIGVGSRRDNIEYVNAGTYYYTSSTAEDSAMTAQIVAHDQLYGLDRGLYRKGINATDTVVNIVNDIIADSGVSLGVSIPTDISTRVIGRNIPVVSHREALRMVAQAAMCVCFINRDDALAFTEIIETTPTDVLDNDNMYSPAKVGITEYINTVEATAYNVYVDSWNDPAEIYKTGIAIYGTKDVWITHGGAEITSSNITGGTIDKAEYYLYACKLTITATAEVELILNGYKVELLETIYRAQNLNGNAESVKKVENPLVRKEFVQDFAEWNLAIEQKRVHYSLQERGHPAREIADTVKIYDAYSENRNAIITRQEYQYDGTLRANTEAWGGGL